ncbi:MAG: hypothetical protein ACYTFG_05830 [Planctomycetota bacterium]
MRLRIGIIVAIVLAVCSLIPVAVLSVAHRKMERPDQCPLGHDDLTQQDAKRSFLNAGPIRIWLTNTLDPPGVYYQCNVCGYRMFDDGLRIKGGEDPGEFTPPVPGFVLLEIEGTKLAFARERQHEQVVKDYITFKKVSKMADVGDITRAFKKRGVGPFVRGRNDVQEFVTCKHQGYRIYVKNIDGTAEPYVELHYPVDGPEGTEEEGE